MVKKQIALALVVGVIGYFLMAFSATGTTSEWMDFAKRNVCIPNNYSFDLYTDTGILHYDAKTSTATPKVNAGVTDYNTTKQVGGLVLFCSNVTTYTECNTTCKKEVEKEYCQPGKSQFGGFVVAPT